jgi:hypothetical protein
MKKNVSLSVGRGEKSPTPAAFKANVKAEVKAGKPVKQAVAIAYAVKKKAK